MKDPLAAKLMAEIAELDEEAARVAVQRAERTRALAAALAGDSPPEVAEPTPPPDPPPAPAPPPPPKNPERRRRLPLRERPRDSRPVSTVGAKRAEQRLRKHGIT